MTTRYTTQYTPGIPALGKRQNAQPSPTPAAKTTFDILFYSWWRTDPWAKLGLFANLEVELTCDYQLLADMERLDLAEIVARVRDGHRPYLARLGGVPAAYGWSAVDRASIGELGLEFAIPAGDRYLWDFATLPAWRGMGIYPRLLHTILSRESSEAERFWIGHVDSNSASQRGILKAGFGLAGTTNWRADRTLAFAATGEQARARACARLLGLRTPTLQSANSA